MDERYQFATSKAPQHKTEEIFSVKMLAIVFTTKEDGYRTITSESE